MTDDEADTIIKVIATADGGCPVCTTDLVDYLQLVLPEYNWSERLIKYQEETP